LWYQKVKGARGNIENTGFGKILRYKNIGNCREFMQ
jgi:hypothetical protein